MWHWWCEPGKASMSGKVHKTDPKSAEHWRSYNTGQLILDLPHLFVRVNTIEYGLIIFWKEA